MLRSFLEAIKILHVTVDGTNYALSAGTTDVNSGAVDALNFRGIAFLVTFGDNADTATFTGKIQGSANGSDGWTDIEGATQSFTAGASDTDHEVQGIECKVLAAYRYYRFVTDRGTANTVIAAVHAALFDSVNVPVSQSMGAGQFVAAPDINP